MLIEMVGYAALHSAGDDRWRCVLCEDMDKFTQEELYNHFTSRHDLDKNDLKLEKGDDIFLYPKNDAKKEVTN